MGVRVVKAFARQRYEIDKFDRDNWEKYRRGKRRCRCCTRSYCRSPITICSAQTLLVLVLGALMVMRSEMTLGTYVAISGMIVWIVWPMRNLGRLIVQVSTGMVSYERVSAIIAEEREDLVAGSFHLEGRPLRGEVIFEDVRFAYAPAPVDGEGSNGHGDREIKDVLQDISFRVQPGQKIALLGATGSGKTSIVNLLLRFYEHNAGHIWLDGVELRGYSKGELRRQIGLSSRSRSCSHSRSARISPTCRATVTDEEVVEAARSAAIHDVILTFPKGMTL
jgi:ATP-binding cassette subfamily B protein